MLEGLHGGCVLSYFGDSGPVHLPGPGSGGQTSARRTSGGDLWEGGRGSGLGRRNELGGAGAWGPGAAGLFVEGGFPKARIGHRPLRVSGWGLPRFLGKTLPSILLLEAISSLAAISRLPIIKAFRRRNQCIGPIPIPTCEKWVGFSPCRGKRAPSPWAAWWLPCWGVIVGSVLAI